jgi:hypothetical protein
MKKLILTILITVFLATAAYGEWGGYTETIKSKGELNIMSIAWVCSSAGGVGNTTSVNVDGYIYTIETIPSTTSAPSDNYDISLKNSSGYEFADLSNRDEANVEVVAPILNSEILPYPNLGPLTLRITNAGNSKAGVINIYYRRAW